MYLSINKIISFIWIVTGMQIGGIGDFQLHAQPSVRIGFYNVENYFDSKHDTLKDDFAFTPEGNYHWTYSRFEHKRNTIYKTLIALGEWSPPAIVGLCEIENDYVLKELCQNTPLRKFNYQYIHYESPDVRGIDVALLYHPEKFTPLESYPISIIFPFAPNSKTRDILYVKGIIFETDTIYLYVNHFPSRLGGNESIQKRDYAAMVLKNSVDSILVSNPFANIIIMGDFNDTPFNLSIQEVLGAAVNKENHYSKALINLMANSVLFEGSHKYKSTWSTIDQFIISKPLYKGTTICVENNAPHIFAPEFLLIDDEKNLGKKPFRTFSGFKYLGGFSDHLPIYLDLKKCGY